MMRSKLRLRKHLDSFVCFNDCGFKYHDHDQFSSIVSFDIQHLNILKDVEVDRVTLIKITII